ncbi:helicase C-terminal domain-containing protein [Staphylococcus aureus]
MIIVRLPFPVPDPVIKRKSKLLGNIEKVIVSEMIMKFKQGTGRLIRTAKDRGLLTILDLENGTKKITAISNYIN